MTSQPREQATNAPEIQAPALEDLTRSAVDEEQIEDAPETGFAAGQRPGVDEIRLQAYYRYLQRDGGDEDEVADWLAAESELRQRGDADAGSSEAP